MLMGASIARSICEVETSLPPGKRIFAIRLKSAFSSLLRVKRTMIVTIPPIIWGDKRTRTYSRTNFAVSNTFLQPSQHSLLRLFYSLHKYRLGFLCVNTNGRKMLKMILFDNTAEPDIFSSKLPPVEVQSILQIIIHADSLRHQNHSDYKHIQTIFQGAFSGRFSNEATGDRRGTPPVETSHAVPKCRPIVGGCLSPQGIKPSRIPPSPLGEGLG